MITKRDLRNKSLIIALCILCIPRSAQSQSITLIKEFSFNHQLASSNVFTPDGKYFVTQQPNYLGLYLRDLATGDIVQTYEDKITVLRHTFNPDGSQIAYSTGNRIIVKNTITGISIKEYDLKQVISICYSHDGSSFLIAEMSQNPITRINSQTGEMNQTYPLTTDSFVFQISFSPDEKRILCFTSKKSILLDASTGDVLGTFAEENGIHAGHATPDFSRIGILNFDYKVQIWQTNPIDTRYAPIEKIWTLDDGKKYHYPAISPNTKYLIVGNWKTNTADLWNIATGKVIQSLEHPAPVLHNVFSPDGSKLITYCDTNKSIRLWDTSGLMVSQTDRWGNY